MKRKTIFPTTKPLSQKLVICVTIARYQKYYFGSTSKASKCWGMILIAKKQLTILLSISFAMNCS